MCVRLAGARRLPYVWNHASVRKKRVLIVMLSLVLPKGSLEKATLDLFDAADLTVRRTSDRD